MTQLVLHKAWLRLPRFTLDVKRALGKAEINLYRVPALRNQPTDVRLELEATDEADATARIRSVLHPLLIRLVPGDFIFPPVSIAGERWGDGPPESPG